MKFVLLALITAVTISPASPVFGVRQRQTAAPPVQSAVLNAEQCNCSIEITAITHATGVPVRDAEIRIEGGQPGTFVTMTSTTDEMGRAAFRRLAQGTYTIRAQRDGYFGSFESGNWQKYVFAIAFVGPAGGTAPPNSVSLPMQQLIITMIQGSAIAGTIQDASNRPAVRVQVEALRKIYQDGEPVLRREATLTQTDDLGHYRIFWLPPGEYFLRTSPTLVQLNPVRNPNYAQKTYYPGSLDTRVATTVVVREGEVADHSDIRIPATGGVTISGTVFNMLPGGMQIGPNGQLNRSISIYFVPHHQDFNEGPQNIINFNPAGGNTNTASKDVEFPFEIRGVPPGSYDLYAVFSDNLADSTRSIKHYAAHSHVEVGVENISGIKTEIQRGVDLTVNLTVSGSAPRGSGGISSNRDYMLISLRPKDNLPAIAASGATSVMSLKLC